MSAIPNQPAVCACLRAGEPFVGKQGFSYAPAISAETVGASAIHMQFLDDSARRAGQGAQAPVA